MSGVKNTNIFKKFLSYRELLKKYNTLANEHELLLELSKNDLFNSTMCEADKEIRLKKLKDENRHLREKIKTLKEIIKNGE